MGTYTAAGPESARARWTLEGPDRGDFTVEGSGMSVMLKFRSSPNYESAADTDTDSIYMVTIKADDGTYRDTHDVTVRVSDVVEVGMVQGDASGDYPENGTSAVATYTTTGTSVPTWTLEGADGGDFSISDGKLSFRSSPNYEMPADADTDNIYMVTVKAAAGGEMDTHAVTITVTNVDEMGRVTLWAGTDALTMAPQVGDTITGAVMDPDGNPGDMLPIAMMDTTINDVTWQWAKTKTPDMMESWMPITGATDAAYMVTEGDTGYHLRVMATYTDAAGTDMAMEDSPATMMVTAMMTVPMFDSETATREVAENTEAGMAIGDPVMGTDADGDTLAYALVGTDAVSFDIDPETGQLMTLAALDYETKDSYEVMVTASDPGGLSDSIDVTITVTNVDEMGEGDPVGGDGMPSRWRRRLATQSRGP